MGIVSCHVTVSCLMRDPLPPQNDLEVWFLRSDYHHLT